MRAFMLRLLVVPMTAFAVGCSGDINNLPTTPDPVIVTETFTGDLTVNGAVTHNVFTGATGTVTTLSGALCVRVYDVGSLTGPVSYTFTVTHP